MHNQAIPLLIFQLAAFIGALGAFFYKKGSTQEKKSKPFFFINFHILLGMLLYFSVMGLFIIAYYLGGRLSVLYSSYAATFIWSLILARIIYKEKITIIKIVGTLCVIGGICLVTL